MSNNKKLDEILIKLDTALYGLVKVEVANYLYDLLIFDLKRLY